MEKDVKKFKRQIKPVLEKEKEKINDFFSNYSELMPFFYFEKFDKENIFKSDSSNKIFFTYSENPDFGDKGKYMSVCYLIYPQKTPNDVGYVKGVATDLSTYINLRYLKNFNHSFQYSIMRLFPKNTTKEIIDLCTFYSDEKKIELDEYLTKKKDLINANLKEITGCSILNYLREI